MRDLFRSRRVISATLLVLIAVLVPCTAWWVAGERQLERAAILEEQSARQRADRLAIRLSERLATRLEVLRAGESRRPFYHYQNLYHDPRGASEGAAVAVSPLAFDTADPLVEAHFQIDAKGRLTLPTLNDDIPELGLQINDVDECALMQRLEDVVLFSTQARAAMEMSPAQADTASAKQVEHLSARAWDQHLAANLLYADLKYANNDRTRPAVEEASTGRVLVEIEPFAWTTLPVGGIPSLIALRRVSTPLGDWTQGFSVDAEVIRPLLADGEGMANFLPSDSVEIASSAVLAEVGETGWTIVVDAGVRLRAAAERTADERSRFRLRFLFGALAAGISGLFLIGLVAQAERLAEQRSRFAASAAHELRTPLAGLRLYGEMLAGGMGDPKRAQDYAKRIAGEAERLGRVVGNVLSFTHLERRTLKLDPQAGDVAAVVREAVERQRPVLEQAGFSVEVEVEEDLPRVQLDRDATTQIVHNLLDNAEKYTREVGEGRRAKVTLRQAGDGAELIILDNGPGIGPELRGKLFRPFMRGNVDEATAGLGLGLVLVRALAEGQGGGVSAGRGPEGGAEMKVRFQAAKG